MTAVIPYFSYAKGDKKDEPRVSIRARVCADAIEAAGLLAGPANDCLDDSPIQRLFMTDSVETQPDPLSSKVEVVSVASLFGGAIRRIARRESISLRFE